MPLQLNMFCHIAHRKQMGLDRCDRLEAIRNNHQAIAKQCHLQAASNFHSQQGALLNLLLLEVTCNLYPLATLDKLHPQVEALNRKLPQKTIDMCYPLEAVNMLHHFEEVLGTKHWIAPLHESCHCY